jgi:hypothetical protein
MLPASNPGFPFGLPGFVLGYNIAGTLRQIGSQAGIVAVIAFSELVWIGAYAVNHLAMAFFG